MVARPSCLDILGLPQYAPPFDHGVGTPVSLPQSRLSDALRLCLVSVAHCLRQCWRHTGVAARTRLSDALRPCRDASSRDSLGVHVFHHLLPWSAYLRCVFLRRYPFSGRLEVPKVTSGCGLVWFVLVACLVSASPFDHGVGTPVSSPQSRLSDALRLCLVLGLQIFIAAPRSLAKS
jgi:hypothetical protein